DVDPELEELSMDAWCAPEWIGEAHLSDQPADFRRYARPSDSPTRFPAPERAEARSMPADNGLRLDDRDGIQDAWCDPIQADEDQTIEIAEDRTFARASTQHIQLMTQSQILRLNRGSRPKQPEEHPPDQLEQVPHGPISWPDS